MKKDRFSQKTRMLWPHKKACVRAILIFGSTVGSILPVNFSESGPLDHSDASTTGQEGFLAINPPNSAHLLRHSPTDAPIWAIGYSSWAFSWPSFELSPNLA
jgi:hypothetical protein